MEVGVSIERAKLLIRENKLNLSSETISLENANGRLLAEGLYSKVHDPRFDNSAMDGFAMRYEDTVDAPAKLEIIGTIQAAGQEDNITVKKGQAVRIMTGAPIPKGADSILQVELTSVSYTHLTLPTKA